MEWAVAQECLLSVTVLIFDSVLKFCLIHTHYSFRQRLKQAIKETNRK